MITKHSRNMNKLWKSRAEDGMKFKRRIICKPRKTLSKSQSDAIDLASPRKIVKREILNDYVECSSVHGVQYFGNMLIKVNTLGKYFWTCIMIVGFACSTFMVMKFWNRYTDNPANTYVKSFHTPIFRTPFPAVTLCPFAHPLYKRRQKLLKDVQLPANLSYEDALFILKYANTLVKPYVTDRHRHLDKFQTLLNASGWSLTDLLRISRPCSDIVQKCWWHKKEIDCTRFMTLSHTSKGICCSFNYMLENYYKEGGVTESPFTYTDRYGAESGLRILLTRDILLAENDTDSLSKMDTNSDGILVYIHHTNDFPGDETSSRILQANKELQLSIAPTWYKKPPGFYSKDERGHKVPLCVATDKGIKYFPKYRYSNCYANCRIEAMLRICGCLPYYYDAVTNKFGIKDCELMGLECLNAYSHHFRIVKNVYTENFTCSCRHPCDNIIYEMTPIEFSIQQEYSALAPVYYDVLDGQAVLRVYWSAQTFMILETIPTDEIYLLASIGGIFSLFLGCSFISAIEIMYFCGLSCRKSFSRRKTNTGSRNRQMHSSLFKNRKLYA